MLSALEAATPPPSPDEYVQLLEGSYAEMSSNQSLQNKQAFEAAVSFIDGSLWRIQNNQEILKAIIAKMVEQYDAINSSTYNYYGEYKILLDKILEVVWRARIILHISQDKGRMGVCFWNDEIMRSTIAPTLSKLMGRVLVYDTNTMNCIYNSSGMITPTTDINGQQFDHIITCNHCMYTKFYCPPNIEIYFVRNEGLNPDTGNPTFADALETVRGKSQSSNFVRRVKYFQPSHLEKANPDHWIPRYNDNQDIGCGFLESSFDLHGSDLLKVELVTTSEFKHLYESIKDKNYYAVGYPGLNRQDDKNNIHYINPIVATSSTVSTFDPSNSLIKHGSKTANGMSGGPILIYDQQTQTLKVLGVIQSGTITDNYMVVWGSMSVKIN